MENRERLVIEILLGLILIVLLVLLAFLVVGISGVSSYKPTQTQTPTAITNSYNTNYNTYQQPRTYTRTQPIVRYTTSKPYFVDDNYRYTNRYRDENARVYYLDSDFYDDDNGDFYDSTYRKTKTSTRYMDYDDSSRLRRSEGIIGNDVNNYEVYVRNEEFKGGYFEVTFYFEDYYGETSRSSETRYIPAREEKKFFYKDISPQRYKYRDWWYDVRSLSKVPEKTYYDEGDYYARDYDAMPMRVYYYR
ncbi:hypothetical protein J4422_00295 [Candidatus Pacearchaeota archaeon]|nr:hypothetical protein [Candidatus Pacearchaeota archaeon]